MKKYIIFILLCLFINSSLLFGVSNPMFKSKKITKIENPVKTYLMQKIIPLQREYNRKLVSLTTRVKTDKKLIFVIIFFAFLYGLIHSLGPGHGKVIITTFFMSREADIKHAAIASTIIGFTHSILAILLILVISLVLQLPALRSFENTSKILAVVSYSIIALIGLGLLVKTLLDIFKTKQKGKHILSEHHHTKHVEHKTLLSLSFFTGLVPCPGAAAIMSFCIASGAFYVGILAILAMSLGMAFTIFCFAAVSILMHENVFGLIFKKSKLNKYLMVILRLFSSAFLLMLGLFLLLMAL